MSLGPPCLSFSNHALERRYQTGQKAKLARTDAGLYLTNACLWLVGSLWITLGRGVASAHLHYGVLVAAAWLLPWPVCQHWPQHYAKYRNWWVRAIRLGSTFQPHLTFGLQYLPPRQHLPPTTVGLISTVALAALVPHMWATALGLRLDISSHLALHALQSAQLATQGACRFCHTNYINNPETLQRFWAIFHQLSNWVILLLPWQQLGSPPTSKTDEPSVHHCVAVTVIVNMLLGFLLPSVTGAFSWALLPRVHYGPPNNISLAQKNGNAPPTPGGGKGQVPAGLYFSQTHGMSSAAPVVPAVYVSERRSRAEFLSREVTARGLGLAQAGEQLGLPAQELVKVCLFDPLTEWLRWVMLLPPLAAATWLIASTLAVRWVSDPARQS